MSSRTASTPVDGHIRNTRSRSTITPPWCSGPPFICRNGRSPRRAGRPRPRLGRSWQERHFRGVNLTIRRRAARHLVAVDAAFAAAIVRNRARDQVDTVRVRLVPNPHVVRLGPDVLPTNDSPTVNNLLDAASKRKTEAWLAALLQVEHLAVLVGNGLSTGVGVIAGNPPPAMHQDLDIGDNTGQLRKHATHSASRLGRDPNIEDQIRSALSLAEGYNVLGDQTSRAAVLRSVDTAMSGLISDVLDFERHLKDGVDRRSRSALDAMRKLQRFLLPLATRPAGRDRLCVFTTNYDRLIEFAADAIGLRIIDRFVGTLSPVFNASRLEVDVHYSPPGLRGEPRYVDGVIRLSKLHGSLDWRSTDTDVIRTLLPFGATIDHPEIPSKPSESVLIYPNPSKSVETVEHPYAELFRDLSATICRPNAVLITFGYGFGDSHINRVISDMLTIPSTHLVVISFGEGRALKSFRDKRYPVNQTSELLGPVAGSLDGIIGLLPTIPMLDLYDRQAQYMELTQNAENESHNTQL